jgi:hypothetical protein
MNKSHDSAQALIEKIRTLPPDRLSEVEDFVDFLRLREQDRQLTEAATRLSEDSFARVWDNPDDAEYDRL